MTSHFATRTLFGTLGLVFVAAALVAQVAPRAAHAAAPTDLTVTPVIIDEKVKPRDILNESISLTNTTSHLLTLYPSVNDVQASDGQQRFQYAYNAPQAAASPSNWIELSRGVIELSPGEEKTVPFVVRVPRDTPVGSYHASISFAQGTTRAGAIAAGPLASVMVNLTLQPDIKELMQLNSFSTDNVVFSGDNALFTYQLQNVGNQPLNPTGDIRIYDRRGEEVASVNVNNQGKIISPDQVSQLASVWNGAKGFGQYKAVIDVDYGTNNTASVQDVTYFWIIPWKQVLGIAIITLIGLILLALYFERWFEDRHLAKLAAAGVLKIEETAMNLLPHRHPPPPSAAATPPERPRQDSPAPASASTDLRNLKMTSAPPPREAAEPTVVPAREKGRMPDLNLKLSRKPESSAGPAQDTIDLKQMMQSRNEPVRDEHIINLKRPSA